MDKLDEFNQTGHSKVFKKAKELGFITAADLVSKNVDFNLLTKTSLPYLDYLSLNEIELQSLANEHTADIKSRSTLTKIATKVLKNGINKYLIVHFPECVFAFGQDGSIDFMPSIDLPASMINGAVGAGDAMYAGILFGVHSDWSIQESLKLGTCAAAQCLLDSSASGSMVDWKECLKLSDKFGHKNY